MPNPWFKFFGQDYLTSPTIDALTASERSCWITLLCLANTRENKIKFLDEVALMLKSGLMPTDVEWDKTIGVLQKFVKLEMISIDNEVITLLNFDKRQERQLTGYERVKRHREKKRNDNAMITSEENRIDKIRIDKNINKVVNYSDADLKLSTLLQDLLKQNFPTMKAPKIEKWADEVRKMRQLDKRTPEQIEFLIYWCQKNQFWKANIMSMGKLREKFDRLAAQSLTDVDQPRKVIKA